MRRTLRILALLSILVTLVAAAFFTRYEILSDRLQESSSFDGIQANSVKHAYAAAQVYATLNLVLGDETSEALVIFLGKVNEYAEQLFKFRSPDSTQEMMKDLYNNQAGITTAQWHRQHAGKTKTVLFYLVNMTRENVLVTTLDPLPAHDEQSHPRDIGAAMQWFSQERASIIARVTHRLSQD